MKTKLQTPSHPVLQSALPQRPRKGDLRKAAIIEALIEKVATQGIENASFESVGKALGIGRNLVNYHFPSREEMVRTMVRYAIGVGQAMTVERIQAARGWKAQLKAWVYGAFDWIERYPFHGAVMRLFYYLCSYEPSYRALHSEIRQTGADRMVGLLEPELGSTLGRSELLTLAKDIQALITGYLLEFTTTATKASLAEMRHHVAERAVQWVEAACAQKKRRSPRKASP